MDFDRDLLASIASGGLGHWVDLEDGSQKYMKDQDCIACLKDLQGFFRYDDPEERPAFFAVSKYNFVRTDLVPLIVTYPEDYDVIYNALKVCTHLTMPSKETSKNLLSHQSLYMRQVCEAFLSEDAIAAIVTLLAEPLSKHPNMDDKDSALVELVITFLRNLLATTHPLPGSTFSEKESCKTLHISLISQFLQEDVMELFLIMAQRARERPFKSQSSVLLQFFLEVFSFSTPEQLVEIPKPQTDTINLVDSNVLEEQRSRERKKAYQTTPKLPLPSAGRTVTRFGPARQQFAGAVFMRRHRDHGSGVLVRHKPNAKELPPMPQAPNRRHAKAQKKDRFLLQSEKFSSRTDSLLLKDVSSYREIQIRNRLKELLNRFLEEAYTPLVGQVFKEARPGLDISRMEEDEFERYVRFVAFCTQYIRLKEEKKIKEKFSKEDEDPMALFDGEDKDEVESKSTESTSPFSSISATMGWDSFHMVQVLFLICVDKEQQRSREKDKPYRQHVLLYSLGPLLREMLMVMELARLAGSQADRQAADRLQRKLLHNDDRTGLLYVLSQLIREYKYHLHPRFHAVHLAEIFHIVLAVLDRLSEHGSFKVSKFQKKRRKTKRVLNKSNPEGIADDHDTEQVNKELQNELDIEPEAKPAPDDSNEKYLMENDASQKDEVKDPESAEKDVVQEPLANDSDQEEEEYVQKEEDFDAARRLRSTCGHPSIVQFYIWLLQGYKSNSDLTNNAILSFLQRISDPLSKGGLGLHCMLWQLSVIRTCHTIMSDAETHKNKQFRKILNFCVLVMRGLFERLQPDLSNFQDTIKSSESEEEIARKELETLDSIEDESERLSRKESVLNRIHGAKLNAHKAKTEIRMKQECAALGFVELLFWKNSTTSESIASEYNWKRHVEIRMAEDGQGAQLGFASFQDENKAGRFSDEQTEALIDAFENYNGTKDYLAKLVFEFGGAFKKLHISRKLKELGLERGKLTERQKNMLIILADRHKDMNIKSRVEIVTHELGGGFTTRQIRSNMKKLGILKSKKDEGPGTKQHSDSDASFGESDDEDAKHSDDQMDAEEAFDDMFPEIETRNETKQTESPDTLPKEGGIDRLHVSNSSNPQSPDSPMRDHHPLKSDIQNLSPANWEKKDVEQPEIGPEENTGKDARQSALEILRSKHKQGTKKRADIQTTEDLEDPQDEDEEHPDGTENADENRSQSPSPVKAFGRRLIKRVKHDAQPEIQTLDTFDELADF
eukprot:jgi/Picsp_1/5122/NSC_02485-R1_timeless family protein